MAELENTTTKPLVNGYTKKFYSRFVDDTLLVVKAEHMIWYISYFNSILQSLYKMFLLGTQLLQNRRIDRRNEGLNKRIGPGSSELVNRNKRGMSCNWVSKSSQPV